MAITPDIISSIKSFFNTYTQIPGHSTINSDGNNFELYIYSLAYKGIQRNHSLSARNLGANGEFIFKCSPGPISQNYSHFEINLSSGKSLELRNGIEYTGHKLFHEIDISVQNASGGRNRTRPSNKYLNLAIECKYYTNANSLKGEARKNIGAITDLSLTAHPLNNASIPTPAGCLHCGIGFTASFTTNISQNKRIDLQDYLDCYGIRPKFGIIPKTSEEADLIDFFEAESLKW